MIADKAAELVARYDDQTAGVVTDWVVNAVEILRLVADSQPQIVSISHGNGAERHTVQILSPEGQYDDA